MSSSPPVNSYWWALGIHLFGDDPFAWKLWRFPFALLFVFGLNGLFRRFAKGLEGPLVWMTVLSPTFFPGFNMMLDIPALGLGLTGLNLFFAACERRSWWRAGTAGLLLGLAMQTKYTGFLLLGAAGIYSVPGRRIRIGLVTAAMATVLFAGWETFIALRYGESHFLHSLLHGQPYPVASWIEFIRPFTVYWGGLAPGLFVLGCIAFGARGRVVAVLTAALAFPYLVVGWLPDSGMEWFSRLHLAQEHQSLNRRLLGMCGLVIVSVVLGLAAWRARRHFVRRKEWGELGAGSSTCRWFDRLTTSGFSRRRGRPLTLSLSKGEQPATKLVQIHGLRVDAFLILWLVLEIVGYFYLSPFAAARRMMGVTVVATAWLGRHASFRCRRAGRRSVVWLPAVAHMILGAGFWAVDALEANAEKSGVERAIERIRSVDDSPPFSLRSKDGEMRVHGDWAPTVWFVGHWGFQFYARRVGMQPVIPYYEPPGSTVALPGPSRLREGDWLVVPDPHIHQQEIALDSTAEGPLEREVTIDIDDPIPLRTVRCYYAGYSPLEHREGPRLSVKLYRVKREFVPN